VNTITINGVEVTQEQMKEYLESGTPPTGTYPSTSKGLVSIKKMATNHIGNALKKNYRDWAANLPDAKEPVALFKAILAGPETSVFQELFAEYVIRQQGTMTDEEFKRWMASL
jgi:hypothetical protein